MRRESFWGLSLASGDFDKAYMIFWEFGFVGYSMYVLVSLFLQILYAWQSRLGQL